MAPTAEQEKRTTVVKGEISDADVAKAKDAYEASKSRLHKAIEASRNARAKWLDNKDDKNLKEAYEKARKEHKDAVDEIKGTRPFYHDLRDRQRAQAK